MKWSEWDRNLKVRLIGEWCFGLFFWMFFPFMAIYFSDTLGKTAAGALLVLSQLLAVAANLVGGYLADTFGRKKMMVISALLQSLAFVVFAVANSPWLESPLLTFLAFTVVSVMGSFYYPASSAMVADIVPEEKQNSVFAIFYTAMNINVVIGPIIGAYFFFHYRFELLLASVVVNFAVTWVLYHFVRETLPPKPAVEKEQSISWSTFAVQQVKNYSVIFKDRVFFLFVVSGILVAQTFTQMDLLLAVYIKEMVQTQTFLHFTINGEKLFSWIIAENGFIVALFTVYVTKLTDRLNERVIFILSSITYGVAMIIFGNTVSVWGMVIAMGIFTLAEIMVVGIQNSFVAKLAPEHMRGQYFAAATLRWSIGRTIAPIAIPMTAWVGYTWTFYSIVALAFLSAFLYHVMFKLFYQKRTEQLNQIVNG
ncbi:MFS transporter [Bacillus sp. 165]|uniref:MDR family MFS transporter n=1 Tax=Bacillus sp. 165 TaxID=1529117 RepID=UPI001ADAF913|nr:MFS transporter [Bacillus sp. 165]MBO9128166.1 MFS transporter [Bacillus sp. 165]